MAERLVVLSDIWGAKKGMWITSYLGYLQQYFDIVYYDSQQLAAIEIVNYTADEVCTALDNGGMQTAIAQLLIKETIPSHYLSFCCGGLIAWNAALKGLPMKSLYAVSPLNIQMEIERPDIPVTLLYGEYQEDRPSKEWADHMNVPIEVVPKFGRELYTDEKIIGKVSLNILESMLKKQYAGL
ncbi:MAG: hypothetical protein KJN76_03660 [Eudoraea sp.]|nr:hypothetical protein [Eudoraea sp.]